MTAKTAKCERTGNEIHLSEGFLVADNKTGEWSFVSAAAPEWRGDYSIPVFDVCKSPEAFVDWMAHLNEKSWFSSKKFADFFTRLRKENLLYGST